MLDVTDLRYIYNMLIAGEDPTNPQLDFLVHVTNKFQRLVLLDFSFKDGYRQLKHAILLGFC